MLNLLLAAALALAVGTAQAAPLAQLTILDGEALLLRDAAKLAAAEGVALQADDIVELGPQARLLRLEFADGTLLDLGPGSRALMAPRLAGERARARVYLLAGWAKASVPKGQSFALLSPALDFNAGAATTAVLALPAGGGSAQLFAEAGELQLRRPGAAAQTLKAGELLSLAGGKAQTLNRPSPDFVQAMPRAFLDSLPARAALFKGKEVAPKRLAALAYADAQPWLTAETPLRRAYLPRWRPLARDAEFRRGLVAGLKNHPEWEPILFPPAPAAASAAAAPKTTY
jgi:hypothetical protein